MNRLPKHQHDFTDEAFLREFDTGDIANKQTTAKSLIEVQSALESANINRAKEALVSHFKTRTKPTWIADLRDGRRGHLPAIRPDTLMPNRTETIRIADRLLQNEFELDRELVLKFGTKLDWVLPDTCDIGVPGNAFRFGRYFHTISAAHAFTRKPAYAKKFAEMIERWVADWPFETDSNFHKDTALFGTDKNYKTMPTGNRLMSWFSCIYSGILFDKHVPAESAFQFLKALWYTAAHFLIFRNAKYHPGNHHVMRCGTVTGVVGIMFPETPRFHPFIDISRKTLTQHAKKSFLSDGGYEERSTSYTNATLEMFLVPLILAKRNRISLLDNDHKAALRRCVEQLATLCQPTGHPAPIGDGGHNNAETFSALLVRMNDVSKSRRIASVMKPLKLDRFIPKEYRLSIAQTLPPLTARFPASGYAIIRSGWSVSDSTVSMSIPDGTNKLPGHAHDDALSVTVVAKGVPIISCPSEELYISVNDRKYRGTPFRGYPYSMEAHNVVLVGGKSLRSPESLGDTWGTPTPAVWSELISTGASPRLVASHTGYPGTTSKRTVSLSDSNDVSVEDQISGPSGIRHLLRWHFNYGVDVDQHDDGYTATKDGVTVRISFESEHPLKHKLYRNSKWMRPNGKPAGASFPQVLDTRFGGTGNDKITTKMYMI